MLGFEVLITFLLTVLSLYLYSAVKFHFGYFRTKPIALFIIRASGKTYMMLGVDDSPMNLGVIPSAIAWLYRLVDERRQTTGARFSVRVSAVEVTGRQETVKDLLANVTAGKAINQSETIYSTEKDSPNRWVFMRLQPPLEWSQIRCRCHVFRQWIPSLRGGNRKCSASDGWGGMTRRLVSTERRLRHRAQWQRERWATVFISCLN